MNRTASLVVRNLLFTILVLGLGGVLAPRWILTSGGHASHPAAWAAVPLIVTGAACIRGASGTSRLSDAARPAPGTHRGAECQPAKPGSAGGAGPGGRAAG